MDLALPKNGGITLRKLSSRAVSLQLQLSDSKSLGYQADPTPPPYFHSF